MHIEDIKHRKAEVLDLLSVVSSRSDKWIARKNDAAARVKLLTKDLEVERKKSLRDEPHSTTEIAEHLELAQHDLEVSKAHLESMSLSEEDKARRVELEKQSKTLLERNKGAAVITIAKDMDKIQRELFEIEARDKSQSVSDRVQDLRSELETLTMQETNFGIYRSQCETEIIQRIDLRFAAIFDDSVKFDDTDFFFDQIKHHCERRLET